MKKALGILALLAAAGLAGVAQASVATSTVLGTASFTNKNSIDAQGDPDNNVDSWIAPSGGTINAIRVTGSLTSLVPSTWALEARVRLTAGAGSSFSGFNYTASGISSFSGTLPIGPTTIGVAPFSLSSGGAVNFEWFESTQDGTPGLPEARWDTVQYEFISNAITNGSANLGSIPANGVPVSYNGSHVSGGLDFITFTLDAPVANLGDYLNISMLGGGPGGMTDTEIGLYSSAGTLLADDDDNGPGNFSELSYGAADPLAAPDLTPGFDGLSLPAGTYTLVTGGFNTVWSSNIANITPGTDSGTYTLNITFVPTPGALALAGLAGLAAARRRRA